MSKRLKIPQTNLYTSLNNLAERGFVNKFKMTTQPALYIARPLEQALPEHYMYLRGLLVPLCRELELTPPPAFQPKLSKNMRYVK